MYIPLSLKVITVRGNLKGQSYQSDTLTASVGSHFDNQSCSKVNVLGWQC